MLRSDFGNTVIVFVLAKTHVACLTLLLHIIFFTAILKEYSFKVKFKYQFHDMADRISDYIHNFYLPG
jgi:hypothetical protein